MTTHGKLKEEKSVAAIQLEHGTARAAYAEMGLLMLTVESHVSLCRRWGAGAVLLRCSSLKVPWRLAAEPAQLQRRSTRKYGASERRHRALCKMPWWV